MKYQSELINEILEDRGHKKSSLHYDSECVNSWIEENKGGYPKLCEYEGEWLNYILEKPIGSFPYETITANPSATVSNVVPYEYKSAIFKGSTKYRDIETGEILETFEEGKNLELVSVEMPVLMTTGKNIVGNLEQGSIGTNGESVNNANDSLYTRSSFILLKKDTSYTFSLNGVKKSFHLYLYDLNKNFKQKIGMRNGYTPEVNCYIRLFQMDNINNALYQVEEGTIATPYEPYQSNILTVNVDVTLRSNGSVYDELDLLTGKLTQRIDENGEVLSQEIVKTVKLTVTNQDGETLSKIKPIEGTMRIESSGTTINPTAVVEIPVEAITQNLNSFIEEE